MARQPHVLIAGAGLGGLTAALALLRTGIDVDIYEQAPSLGDIGAGVQLAANGTRVIYELGFGQQLEDIGTSITGKEIRLWSTGKRWDLIDLGAKSVERYGAPYFTLHRADLHRLLVEAVRSHKTDAFHLGSTASHFEEAPDQVVLHLSEGRKVSGDALIGADGVHSRIRQGLLGPDKPRFTGCMAWRGLIPTEKLPESVSRTSGVFWLGPGAHIVTYPVRNGKYLNFIGIINRDDWRVESWSARGSIEECAADFSGWNDDVQAMIRNMEVPYKWGLIMRDPLPWWTRGRVTLLGDACHSMLPLLAQGANMALEDAMILGRSFQAFSGDVEAALAAYEKLRRSRTSAIVQASAAQLERNTTSALNDPDEAEAHIRKEWTRDRVNDRYEWIYSYDATTVPIN